MRPLAPILLFTLAACSQQAAPPADAERVPIAQGEARAHDPLPSPDTQNASWSVDDNGKALHFGDEGQPPHLSLDCLLDDGPAKLAIIRHAPALPGEEALFPIYGNGMRSRFLADAALHQAGETSEWRWEAILPADDPQLDVFLGTRDLTATLPGKGMLAIAGSRIPGEFVEWCRTGGRVAEVVSEEEAAVPPPDQ